MDPSYLDFVAFDGTDGVKSFICTSDPPTTNIAAALDRNISTPCDAQLKYGVQEPKMMANKMAFQDCINKYFDSIPDEPSPRNLVKVRHIEHIEPLIGSPTLAVVYIDGWVVVVPRGQFQVGQFVVYFEIDSFLPANIGKFRNVRAPNQVEHKGQWGYHIKSTSFNGQLSQGVIMPVKDVPPVNELMVALADLYGDWDAMTYDIGTHRFAELLGVTKWEPKVTGKVVTDNRTEILGKRPLFFPETAATRVQNCPNLFCKRKYFHSTYQETIKMDGESMTVYFVRGDSEYYRSCNRISGLPTENMVQPNGRFGVCSHKKELNETVNSKHWAMARIYELPGKLNLLNKNIAIQGELVGATIQQNRENYEDGNHDFMVFDIYDLDKRQYVDPRSVVECAKELGLPHVEVRGYVNIRKIAKDHVGLLKRARDTGREGLVFKCLNDGRRFKVINDEWLLRHDI